MREVWVRVLHWVWVLRCVWVRWGRGGVRVSRWVWVRWGEGVAWGARGTCCVMSGVWVKGVGEAGMVRGGVETCVAVGWVPGDCVWLWVGCKGECVNVCGCGLGAWVDV